MQQAAQNKEFIDEEIVKIIGDAFKGTFDLKVKYENSESNMVDVVVESDREKETISNLFYKNEKVELWSSQMID